MGRLLWKKEIPPKPQTTDSLWVGRRVLGTLRWATKKPSLFKQPDFGIQRDSELVCWLFVAALRGARRYSPPHAVPTPLQLVTDLTTPQAGGTEAPKGGL